MTSFSSIRKLQYLSPDLYLWHIFTISHFNIYIYIYISYQKKVRFIINYNKFKTSNLIISNNSFPSTELLDQTNLIYMFKCPLGDCVSKENNAYVDLTTTTLSRQLTMHINDSISLTLHLKTHSIPKSKF